MLVRIEPLGEGRLGDVVGKESWLERRDGGGAGWGRIGKLGTGCIACVSMAFSVF